MHGCTLSIDLEYVGGNYGDRINSRYYYIDHRLQYNAALLYAWQMFKARAEFRNITGAQLKDITGAPLPGRQWYASLACKF
jgi:hypothetical protein